MDYRPLPLSVVRLVDQVCDEFEKAWRDGGRPRIEDYVPDESAAARSAALRALVASELELRRQLGERPAVEEYLGRFPADAELVRSAFSEDAATVTALPRTSPSPAQAPAAAEEDAVIAHEVSHSVADTRPTLGKRIWAWPLLAALILTIAGIWARATIERVMREQMASKLLALRDADVTALQISFDAHRAIASIAASEPRVQSCVRSLLARGERDTATLLRAPEQAELRAELGAWLGKYEYDGFRVLDRQGHSIASWRDVTVGGQARPEEIECLNKVLAGRATVSRPRPSEVLLPDTDGKERIGLPTMFVFAPIYDKAGRVIAALGFRMRPDRTFTQVLNVARFGQSGETFAFDGQGLLLSESRFDDVLKRIRLITDAADARSTLSLELRDPGVDLTTGARPAQPRAKQALTRLVIEAMQGGSGVDVDGDRDYRGVPVIGAWTWLPEYGFGVITKVDRAEAYRPLAILQAAFWSLFALLAGATIALFVYTALVARLGLRAQAAAQVARRLGRYTLDTKIGEGGMGVVYRAHHAMLRRPTAVKLLRPEKTNERSIARFEREVQLTSQLTHPNTITVYDYGRTSDGIFYYAMEYLDGVDLQTLVDRHGPQPDGRVIHVLAQVCGSLAEAHEIGLIHRDIKPSNIILTRRGGMFDFAKLVDFGLAKAVDAGRVGILTPADSIVGTPLYMAPEAIRNPDQADARSDLYAVGAVGYFLVAGRPIFTGRSVADILLQHVSADPEPPSTVRGSTVSPELEALLLRCLAKEPASRPESAQALAQDLGRIPAGTWSPLEAATWWQRHAPGALAPVPSPGRPEQAPEPGLVAPDLSVGSRAGH
jgi:eukaryotic-like serine/threonine-protein kinase